MSLKKHEEFIRHIEELSAKGLIRLNLSLCVVLSLLISMNDGTWRMCVDSQAVNKITVLYCFSIPRLDDLLDQLSRATIFDKLDLSTIRFGFA